jgi:hypothetical protein
MGLMRSSFVRTMAFQSTTKFLPGSMWFLGSLEFLTAKFGNLSLQEPELSKVTGSGSGYLPPAPDWVSLVNEAQHGLGSLGKIDRDPVEDRADHTLAAQAAATDPIYLPPSGSDSEYGREVYMVEHGSELLEKTTEELQWEAEEENSPSRAIGPNSTRGMGTMACRMTQGTRRMSTRMEPLQGGTILSSTHDATLTEIISDIGHDRSVRNLIRSSTKESKITAR